ncbi:MAG: hypothetical protein F6K39_37510, partial [Okeania sp. SIO3B3]|nr:hypothetical protein [Okeania sp. SIO3B3]
AILNRDANFGRAYISGAFMGATFGFVWSLFKPPMLLGGARIWPKTEVSKFEHDEIIVNSKLENEKLILKDLKNRILTFNNVRSSLKLNNYKLESII